MSNKSMKDFFIENVSITGYWLEDFTINSANASLCICIRKNFDGVNTKHKLMFGFINSFSLEFDEDEVDERYTPTILGLQWDGDKKFIFTTDTFEAEFCARDIPNIVEVE